MLNVTSSLGRIVRPAFSAQALTRDLSTFSDTFQKLEKLRNLQQVVVGNTVPGRIIQTYATERIAQKLAISIVDHWNIPQVASLEKPDNGNRHFVIWWWRTDSGTDRLYIALRQRGPNNQISYINPKNGDPAPDSARVTTSLPVRLNVSTFYLLQVFRDLGLSAKSDSQYDSLMPWHDVNRTLTDNVGNHGIELW